LRWDREVIGVRHRDHTGLKYAVTRSSNDFPKSLQPATLIVISHRWNYLSPYLSHLLTIILYSLSHPHYIYPNVSLCCCSTMDINCGCGTVGMGYYSFTEFGSPSSCARVCVYIIYVYRLTVAELRKGSKRMPNEDCTSDESYRCLH